MYFYNNQKDITEKLAVKILNDLGVRCALNNIDDITAVDIIANNGLKIDVQFSCNYLKYGDCRLDLVSAFYPRFVNRFVRYDYDNRKKFFENFQAKYNCSIRKYGKIFQNDYVDALIILFYNYQFSSEPDNILIFKCPELKDAIIARASYYFDKIKINDKTKYGLNDGCGSAFLPINAKELALATGGFFGTKAQLISQKEQIVKYLS